MYANIRIKLVKKYQMLVGGAEELKLPPFDDIFLGIFRWI